MSIKTDLAKEIIDGFSSPYADAKKFLYGKTEITEVLIKTKADENLIGKPKGRYVTVESDFIKNPFDNFDEEVSAIAHELRRMLPEKGDILAVGIGNESLAADSLGPLSAKMLFCGEFFERRLFSLVPGVEGKTGADPAVLIKAAAEALNPSAIVAIDSLASNDISHICKTVQLSDAGILPGSGAGRAKSPITKESMGLPVIAVGTPTVSAYRDEKSFVVPTEGEALIKRAARLIFASLELAVFPKFGIDFIKELAAFC